MIDCAASVATLFEAHLDGIACVYQAMNPMIASEAAAVVMAAEYETGVEQAAIVLDQFEIAARRLDIPHDAKSTFNVSYAATRTVTEMSRLYDLNIVAQPDRSNPSQADFLSEAVLFGSGRPMLMIPYITRGPVKTDRVLICWDGGVPAARAVHNAMPFLRKATTIDIVAVNEKEEAAGEVTSAALIAHLARRDLPATSLRLTADV
ncbi:MAG TPA: universal stress protein, partial [Bradyrhizobium sp.]